MYIFAEGKSCVVRAIFATIFIVMVRVDLVNCREKPPPGCSISAAFRCEDNLRACEKRNNSVHEEFCQCYEKFTKCLVAINPKACMRGAYCYLNDHRCVHFNCAFNAKRCRKCYARTEYDMTPDEEDDLLQAFVHHTAVSIPSTIVFFIGLYVGIGQYRNVKYFIQKSTRITRGCFEILKYLKYDFVTFLYSALGLLIDSKLMKDYLTNQSSRLMLHRS